MKITIMKDKEEKPAEAIMELFLDESNLCGDIRLRGRDKDGLNYTIALIGQEGIHLSTGIHKSTGWPLDDTRKLKTY